MASMHAGLKQRVDATVGAADLRVSKTGKESLSQDVLERVRAWPEVRVAVARAQGPIILKNPANSNECATVGSGVDPTLDAQVRAVEIVEGRRASALGEIALDTAGMKELGAKVGDALSVSRWGDAITLKIVGVVRQPGIGMGVVTRLILTN